MRYHLNIRNATGLILDEEGAEFSNLRAARTEAFACAAEFLIADLRRTGAIRKQRIEISDENGPMVASVGFRIMLHEDCEPKGPIAAIRSQTRKLAALPVQS